MFSSLEKKIFKQGYRVVAGIDDVGRGPLAGPVAAAAVMVDMGVITKKPKADKSILTRSFASLRMTGSGLTKIRDSKRLSAGQREEIFEMVKNEPAIEWRVSYVWSRVIDRINIWQATRLAWRRCLKKLNPQPDFLFLDGKFDLAGNVCKECNSSKSKELHSYRRSYQHFCQYPVIKGDQKIWLLSLASIIAKVSRDKLMERLDKKHPGYEFSQHKGYGTKLHLARLKKFGPCGIHRKSFRPVFENLSLKDKVYYVVSQIPRGQVMTYQEVAQKINQPRAWRAVGNALNKNIDPRVPCHRVIRSNGRLGGYNRGSQFKKELLRKEMSS